MTLQDGARVYESFDDIETAEHRRSEELMHYLLADRLWHRQIAGLFPPTSACSQRLVPIDHRPQSRFGPLCRAGCFSEAELAHELTNGESK